VFMLLLQYGADPTTDTASIIEQAAKSGSLDIIKVVTERDKAFRDSGNAVLGFACLYGHFAIVRYLVEEGISSKASNDINNAFLDAIGTGNLTIIQYLTEQGADIDLAIQEGNARTQEWAAHWKRSVALKEQLEGRLPEASKRQMREKI